MLGLVAAVVLVWLGFALAMLWSARAATRAGVDRLERARDVLTPEGIVDGEGVDLLRTARADFERARERVRSPWVAPLRAVPVLGRQVRSVDSLTAAASDVVDIGVDASEAARAELERTPADAGSRARTAARLAAIARRADESLTGIDLGPADGLVGPLRDARSRFVDELTGLRDATRRVRLGSLAFARFLEGPSRYLVVAANNNEMRIGSGTFLSVGQLDVSDGALDLSDMRSVGDVDVPPGAVTIGGDLADLWGWLQPQVEWQNLAASPRFETQASVAAQMWRAATGADVDGVIVLDPVALRALLLATGPVVVEGVEYSAGNVLDELYLRQYEVVDEGSFNFANAARRDRLAAIARAVLTRFDEGGYAAVDLFEALRDAALGRHVLVWARDPEMQRGWEAARVAGVLEPDSFIFGLHNRAANKLDQFLEIRAELQMSGEELEVAVEVVNRAPEGLPAYVEGPAPGAQGAAAGLYQGLLTFVLPPGVGTPSVGQGEAVLEPVALGPDGPYGTIAAYVEVPRGEARAFVLRARLHPDLERLRIEPSARVPEVTWTFRGASWPDDRARTVHR